MDSESLPLEIIDLILEYLRTDRQALTACSLVSKAWHLSCRFHILAEHTIDAYDLREEHSPPCDLSVLSQYTRNLLLRNFTPDKLWPKETRFYNKVTTLYFMSSRIDRARQPRISSTFTLVSRLVLHSTRFDLLADMVQMICLLPMLESLTLVECNWLIGPGEPMTCRSSSMAWRSLSIQNTQLDPILEWLISLKPPPNLTTVTFFDEALNPMCMNLVNDTIISLRESLQHLSFTSTISELATAERINLLHNPKLRKLELFYLPSIRILIEILEASKQKSSELEEITFSTLSSDDAHSWRTLDRSLVDMHHSKTSFVRLVYFVHLWNESEICGINTLAILMPRSWELGVLKVVLGKNILRERSQELMGLEWHIKINSPLPIL